LNDAGWKFVMAPEVALKFEAERIVVVGIPRQENSKQQVPWPEAVLPAQVGVLPEEWEEKQVLMQEQKPQVHSYEESFNFLANDCTLQHTTQIHP